MFCDMNATMGPPSMLIVPGASALPFLYSSFVSGVEEKGYDIQALHLPSIANANGSHLPGLPTMYDDATFVRSNIANLSDAGKDVILITHSYGGTPATQSLEGLSKKERRSKGLAGGVVALAYITSLIPELGEPASSVQAPMPEESKADGWIYYPNLTRSAELSFTDLPLEEGIYWASKLAKMSSAAFASNLTYQGFKNVPVFYLFCENDLTIPPEYQQAGIDMVENITHAKVDVTRIDSDHVAPLSHTQETVDWITKVAESLSRT